MSANTGKKINEVFAFAKNEVECKRSNEVVPCGHKHKNITAQNEQLYFWRQDTDLNQARRGLQTRALPIGYVAEVIRLRLSRLLREPHNDNYDMSQPIFSGKGLKRC